MKRKFTPEELFAYVLLIAFSILVLAFTFRIAYKERDYLASGESIDLNEYIKNIRLYNIVILRRADIDIEVRQPIIT